MGAAAARSMGQGSGVERAQARGPNREPKIEELEDVLYDILAVGVEPTAQIGTLDAVQVFLHEHARVRKTHAEMLSFFAENGIAYTPERARAVAPPLALLPIEGTETDDFLTPPAAISGIQVSPEARTSRSSLALRLGVACAAVVVLALGAVGYLVLADMQHELSRVNTQAGTQAAELSRVKADADALRATMRDNAELVRSVDRKSDVLIQSLLSPLDPQKLERPAALPRPSSP